MEENRELLILYLADELDTREREDFEAQLEHDAELRLELEAMRSMLELTRARAPDDPGSRYWNNFWARLQPKLKRKSWWQQLVEFFAPRRGLRVATVMGTLAAALIMAVVLLYQFAVGPEVEPLEETTSFEIVKRTDGFFERAAGSHLERSRLLLQDVVNVASNGSPQVERLIDNRKRGEELLSQNRSFRHAAESQKNAKLAKLLEELELILIDIANLDTDVAQEALNSLQRRIAKKKLLSKIEILSSSAGPV